MRFFLAILILALAACLPLAAHHAFAAEFSAAKPVNLTGTVTRVAWLNPHARFYLTVTEGGSHATWELVMGSPNVLSRQGWSRTTLKEGDRVTVRGYVAKDGSHTAAARMVRTPDGRQLFFGSAGDGGPDK